MKKLIFGGLLIYNITYATTLSELFDALKNAPKSSIDKIICDISTLNQNSIDDKFYPTLNFIGSYELYNSPTNLRPVTPTESSEILTQKDGLPFSKRVTRVGIEGSMPIYLKELFSLKKKISHLIKSAKLQKRANFLQNEAVLVGAYSNLIYIKNLEIALNKRLLSLKDTKDKVKVKVKNGRSAETELLKIDDLINSFKLKINSTEIEKTKAKEQIKALVGIDIKNIENISLKKEINSNDIFMLKPEKEKINATKYDLKANSDKLYPKVFTSYSWFKNYGEAYNNNQDIDRDYSNIKLIVQIPIFDKSIYTNIEKSKMELLKEKNILHKTKMELEAKADNLKETIKLLKDSQKFLKRKIKNQTKLLNVAKIAYESGRLDSEEYLRYEVNFFNTQAEFYAQDTKLWQSISTLAVIYGNDLEELIK